MDEEGMKPIGSFHEAFKEIVAPPSLIMASRSRRARVLREEGARHDYAKDVLASFWSMYR